MEQDKDLKDLFAKQKTEIQDNGFSRQVINRLPSAPRRSFNLLAYGISLLGIGIALWILFDANILMFLIDFLSGLSFCHIPSVESIALYIGILGIFSGFAISTVRYLSE